MFLVKESTPWASSPLVMNNKIKTMKPNDLYFIILYVYFMCKFEPMKVETVDKSFR